MHTLCALSVHQTHPVLAKKGSSCHEKSRPGGIHLKCPPNPGEVGFFWSPWLRRFEGTETQSRRNAMVNHFFQHQTHRDCQCSQKHWQCINNAMTANCNNGAASSLIQNKQQEPTQQPQTPKQKHKAHPNQHQDNTHMQDRSTVGRGTEKVKHTSLPYSLADVLLQQTVHTGINHSAISLHQKRPPIHKSPVQINSSHHSVPFSFFY